MFPILRPFKPAILFNFDRTNCELMAQHILESLERKEEEWRSRSVEWTRKMKQWNVWHSQAKVRERVSERQQKQKRRPEEDEDSRDTSDISWESSFNPNHPSPQFSFVGLGTSYSMLDLEADTPTKELSWSNVPLWAMKALRRGIAVHHAGMNKHYRTLVERWANKFIPSLWSS
jgi:superfamily II RNA helicase